VPVYQLQNGLLLARTFDNFDALKQTMEILGHIPHQMVAAYE
jgi:hypothetical protein